MKIDRAQVTEQTWLVELSTADLKRLLPPTLRRAVDAGATFEASVAIPSAGFEAGDKMLVGADVPIVLTVKQSARK